MASTFTGNYAGEKAVGYVAPHVLAANTLAQNAVTIHDNIRYRLNVRNMDVTGAIKNATCDFSDTSQVNMSDVILQPKEFQVNLQLCKNDFQDQWEALEMRGQLIDQDLPASFTDFLVDQISKDVAKGVEVDIWQGTDTTDRFQGIESRLAADTDVVDVAGTTLTAANIITEIAKVYDAITDAVFSNQEDLRIYISIKAARLYQRALGFGQIGSNTNINSYQNQLVVGEKPMDFQGIPLVVCNGLSTNKMVASTPSNLHFGTNVLTDMNNFQIIDMSQYDGSQNFRYVVRYTAGTQITNGQDIVYYS